MEIKNLANTDHTTIVDCLNKSFAGYYVQMSADPGYWKSRFRMARIDMHLSFGSFHNGKLVGFILTGVDSYEGLLTAYNGGTGVIPDYRNQGIVAQLYDAALPHFRAREIKRCVLEVIEQNLRAIKVYERIGFYKTKFYYCFKGFLPELKDSASIREIPFDEINKPGLQESQMLCWDHTAHAMQLSGVNFNCYAVEEDQTLRGYFMVNPENGYVSQLLLTPGTEEAAWEQIIASIGRVYPSVKLNNIDARRHSLVAVLRQAKLDNFINQYEMEKPLIP